MKKILLLLLSLFTFTLGEKVATLNQDIENCTIISSRGDKKECKKGTTLYQGDKIKLSLLECDFNYTIFKNKFTIYPPYYLIFHSGYFVIADPFREMYRNGSEIPNPLYFFILQKEVTLLFSYYSPSEEIDAPPPIWQLTDTQDKVVCKKKMTGIGGNIYILKINLHFSRWNSLISPQSFQWDILDRGKSEDRGSLIVIPPKDTKYFSSSQIIKQMAKKLEKYKNVKGETCFISLSSTLSCNCSKYRERLREKDSNILAKLATTIYYGEILKNSVVKGTLRPIKKDRYKIEEIIDLLNRYSICLWVIINNNPSP